MKERKVKNSSELLGLELVSLMIKKSRWRWFGHVEWKDDNDWVQCCNGAVPQTPIVGVYRCISGNSKLPR